MDWQWKWNLGQTWFVHSLILKWYDKEKIQYKTLNFKLNNVIDSDTNKGKAAIKYSENNIVLIFIETWLWCLKKESEGWNAMKY